MSTSKEAPQRGCGGCLPACGGNEILNATCLFAQKFSAYAFLQEAWDLHGEQMHKGSRGPEALLEAGLRQSEALVACMATATKEPGAGETTPLCPGCSAPHSLTLWRAGAPTTAWSSGFPRPLEELPLVTDNPVQGGVRSSLNCGFFHPAQKAVRRIHTQAPHD